MRTYDEKWKRRHDARVAVYATTMYLVGMAIGAWIW